MFRWVIHCAVLIALALLPLSAGATMAPVRHAAAGRVAQFTSTRASDNAVLENWQYGHNKNGDKLWWQRAFLGKRLNFTYDSISRLVASAVAGGGIVQYALDTAGNRETVTGGADPGPYGMSDTSPPADDAMNQYTTTPYDTRTYDNNGNVTSIAPSPSNPSEPSRAFACDCHNRLVNVAISDGATVRQVDYEYDAFSSGDSSRSILGRR